jgi:hypothetical protein
MKKNLASAAVMTILVLAAAVPLFAQQSGPMKVNVPFNFVMENERMQAGEYTIQPIANGFLLIRRTDGKGSANVLALPKQAKTMAKEAQVVFHRYGGEYFLSEIWTPGQNVGRELLKGRLEAEVAKKGAPLQLASLTAH